MGVLRGSWFTNVLPVLIPTFVPGQYVTVGLYVTGTGLIVVLEYCGVWELTIRVTQTGVVGLMVFWLFKLVSTGLLTFIVWFVSTAFNSTFLTGALLFKVQGVAVEITDISWVGLATTISSMGYNVGVVSIECNCVAWTVCGCCLLK